MQLLRRYKQPGRASQVETVVVAGPHHVAARGKRVDLRTGEHQRSVGALFGRDGAWVEWKRDGTLWLMTPAGASTQLQPPRGLSVMLRAVGDEVVLLEADMRQPLLCMSRETGQPLGRLVGQRGEKDGKATLYSAHVIDPGDGKTVWLVEGGALAHFDLATRKALRLVNPPAGEKFLGLAVHASGALLTTARKKSAEFDGKDDELVLLSPDGATKRAKQTSMSLAPLADGFVVFDPEARQFVFYDLALKKTGTLAHDSNWAVLVPLPSRREWISIGGKGEWDHHGEASLAPTGAAPAPAAKKKAAGKKKK